MLKEGDLIVIQKGAYSLRNKVSLDDVYEYKKTYVDRGNQVAIVQDANQQEYHVPIRFIVKI